MAGAGEEQGKPKTRLLSESWSTHLEIKEEISDAWARASLMAQTVKNLPKSRLGFDLWVRKIPWWKERLPTPVFLPGKFHGQRDVFHFHAHSLYKPRNANDCQQIPQFSSVQTLSCVRLSATPWTVAWQASLSITNSWHLLKLMSIESVMPSNHLILYRPLLLLPSIFSSIRVFSNESTLHIRWPKYWSFSLSISPSNEYSGLFSFRIDWFDLLADQGTLKSLLQHHNSKASIFQHSAFFN